MRRSTARCISEFNFGQTSLKRQWRPDTPKEAAKDSGIKISKLGNGVQVVTHDKDGPVASFGIFANAGAKFEPRKYPGVSHVLSKAFLLGNAENSAFQVDRTLGSLGASWGSVEVRKRLIGVRAELRRDAVEAPFQALLQNFVIPTFNEADLEQQRDIWDNDLEEMRWRNPRAFAVDELENVAFAEQPLGQPRFVRPQYTDKMTRDTLLPFWGAHVIPSRMVIVGVNVNHDELIAAYEAQPYVHSVDAPHHKDLIKGLKDYSSSAELKQYVGGETRFYESGVAKERAEEQSTFAIGYLTHGAEGNVKQYASSLVLQGLLDGHISGASDRIERRPNQWGYKSFYSPFAQAGLVGITLRDAAKDAEKKFKDSFKILDKAVKGDLQAAKRRAAVQFAVKNSDQLKDYVAYLAGAVDNGVVTPPADVIKAIESVTDADIKAVHALAHSVKPSYAAVGYVDTYPSIRALNL